MSLKWTDDLSVGDKNIDKDHQELFELVNDLTKARMSHDYINAILERLKRYTIEHFSHEEVYMRKYNYPDLEAHLKEHAAFVEWLNTIRSMYARFPQSPFIVGDSVNSYLNRWWREHILEEDMKYGQFILDKKHHQEEKH
jgi:hemerythrin